MDSQLHEVLSVPKTCLVSVHPVAALNVMEWLMEMDLFFGWLVGYSRFDSIDRNLRTT